ncbi:MAG: hypothetical protein JNN30_12435 [Rhodanobacteraceae bacterium]|nr:hypothetical protein [Rhodanobacteraceae bacterium]
MKPYRSAAVAVVELGFLKKLLAVSLRLRQSVGDAALAKLSARLFISGAEFVADFMSG